MVTPRCHGALRVVCTNSSLSFSVDEPSECANELVNLVSSLAVNTTLAGNEQWGCVNPKTPESSVPSAFYYRILSNPVVSSGVWGVSAVPVSFQECFDDLSLQIDWSPMHSRRLLGSINVNETWPIEDHRMNVDANGNVEEPKIVMYEEDSTQVSCENCYARARLRFRLVFRVNSLWSLQVNLFQLLVLGDLDIQFNILATTGVNLIEHPLSAPIDLGSVTFSIFAVPLRVEFELTPKSFLDVVKASDELKMSAGLTIGIGFTAGIQYSTGEGFEVIHSLDRSTFDFRPPRFQTKPGESIINAGLMGSVTVTLFDAVPFNAVIKPYAQIRTLPGVPVTQIFSPSLGADAVNLFVKVESMSSTANLDTGLTIRGYYAEVLFGAVTVTSKTMQPTQSKVTWDEWLFLGAFSPDTIAKNHFSFTVFKDVYVLPDPSGKAQATCSSAECAKTVTLDNFNAQLSVVIRYTQSATADPTSTDNNRLFVRQPTSGSVAYKQDEFEVKWVSIGLGSLVSLSLDLIDDGDNVVAVDVVPNTGSYTWSVSSALATGWYRLRFFSHSLTPQTSAAFEIKEKDPTLTLLPLPSNVIAGETAEVLWESNMAATKLVSLSVACTGMPSTSIADNIPNSQQYEWRLQYSLGAQSNCVMKIKYQSFAVEASSNAFSIASSTAQLSLSLSPTGTLPSESSLTVSWTYSGNWAAGDTLALSYVSSANKKWALANVLLTTGQYATSVPLWLPSGVYHVEVHPLSNPLFSQQSATFTINRPAMQIALSAPVLNSQYKTLDGIQLQWVSSNLPTNHVLALSITKDGGNPVVLLSEAPNNGSLVWFVDQTVSTGQYRFTLTWTLDDTISATSSLFAIQHMDSTLTLTAPEATTIVVGSTFTIAWTSFYVFPSSTVLIKLCYDGWLTDTEQILAANVPNTGSYSATMPFATETGSYYFIKLAIADNHPPLADSGNFFVVAKPSATLAVSSPTGGLVATTYSTLPIRWTSTLIPADRLITIELYQDETLLFDSKVASMSSQNTGSLDWTIPFSVPTYSSYYIQLVWLDQQDVKVESSRFRINRIATSFNINTPNSGTTWSTQNAGTVTWSYTGLQSTERLTIELWGEDMVLYFDQKLATLSSDAPNSGEFSWTVPLSVNVNAKAYLVMKVNSAPDDYSYESARFNLVKRPAALNLLSPTSGSVAKGVFTTITWSTTAIASTENIIIELWYDDWLIDDLIMNIAVAPNTGSYQWRVPANLASDTYYLYLKVQSNTDIHSSGEPEFRVTSSRRRLLEDNTQHAENITGLVPSRQLAEGSGKCSGSLEIAYQLFRGVDVDLSLGQIRMPGSLPLIGGKPLTDNDYQLGRLSLLKPDLPLGCAVCSGILDFNDCIYPTGIQTVPVTIDGEPHAGQTRKFDFTNAINGFADVYVTLPAELIGSGLQQLSGLQFKTLSFLKDQVDQAISLVNPFKQLPVVAGKAFAFSGMSFELSALDASLSATIQLGTFIKPITVAINFSSVPDMDSIGSTSLFLKLWSADQSAWIDATGTCAEADQRCTVEWDKRTIECSVCHFTQFAIFSEVAPETGGTTMLIIIIACVTGAVVVLGGIGFACWIRHRNAKRRKRQVHDIRTLQGPRVRTVMSSRPPGPLQATGTSI
eukprot:GILJ01014485.1.p1 GENE.GILJ01014485.1~~GILJ01014485.1.p1  ORF type:complete len:1642 (-),score=222.18 GILJ01014485.1:78-4967(-)